ncbi:MAG: DUF488 domain-containing protein [Planctomycetaceae bacterium]|nr:DUF488 domain-containing protein [Planctomycetaceae bacterium]
MTNKPSIRTIRAYDVDDSNEGYRVLVDRLWPRGVKKESLNLDQWAKDLAPSTDLRKWFDHDPEKWDEFQGRYADELAEKKDARQALLDEAGQGPILLIYAAKDEQHNHAIVLQNILEQDRS